MKKNGVNYNKKTLIKIFSLVIAIILIIFTGEVFYNNLISKNINLKQKQIANTYSVDNFVEMDKNTDLPKVENKKINSNKKDKEQELNKETDLDKDENKEENSNKKIAYLTFDDGPSAIVTPKVLDVLKAYDIKATFFVLGKNVEENPKIFKRIIEEGHGIANHSYSHDYKKIYNSVESLTEEIIKTNETIDRFSEKKMNTKVFRFPGGSFDKKKEYKNAVKEMGMQFYDWNCLNGDAEGHNIPKEVLVEKIKKTAGDQKELMILMHDTNAKITTVDALSETIEYLRDKGYEFKALQ